MKLKRRVDISTVQVYDNGGQTLDRYTVGLKDGSCLALSDDCDSPEGVSVLCPHYAGTDCLGEQISFSELPLNVQSHVRKKLNLLFTVRKDDSLSGIVLLSGCTD